MFLVCDSHSLIIETWPTILVNSNSNDSKNMMNKTHKIIDEISYDEDN